MRVGMALVGWELEVKRYLCIHLREGIIESVESWSSCSSESPGGEGFLALPQPGNAHVHSADHAFPEYGVDMGLKELVAPPHGLKHRLLESTPPSMLVDAISEFYTLAWSMGLGLLVDFREGGGRGCKLAQKAKSLTPKGLKALILGRPGPEWPEGCEGLGVSSPLDYEVSTLKRLSSEHKPAMAHVAEDMEARIKGDFEGALEAGLDAIIHGVYLKREDLEAMRDKGVALIFCPQSNMWHGLGSPPIAEAFKVGVKTALGSDNASWNTPEIWGEARAALLIARMQGFKEERAALEVLKSIMVNPYTIVGGKPPIIEEGYEAKMIIADTSNLGIFKALNPYSGIVKRVSTASIIARVDGGDLKELPKSKFKHGG